MRCTLASGKGWVRACFSALTCMLLLVSAADAHQGGGHTVNEAAAEANTAADAQPEVYLAPGWGSLSFEAPAPGTYQLPPMRGAAGGRLLGTEGQPVELADLLSEKVVLLSFIYRTCDDVNGCPLSTMVLRTVAKRLRDNPELADALRLVTISFDPENDTPAEMAEFARMIRGEGDARGERVGVGVDERVGERLGQRLGNSPSEGEGRGERGLDWQFLTSESDAQIAPVLEAYQQFVVEDAAGQGGGKFSHILRVYLIDTDAQIRNIYSLSFLHPDILVNDVETLVMEDARRSVAASP